MQHNVVCRKKPSDAQSPRWIDCYATEDGEYFKLDPARVLFSIEFLHSATPPAVKLRLSGWDPALWFDRVGIELLSGLCQFEPHIRDRLPLVLHSAVMAARGH
jgi:hypothetical protein